jgi:hypothetical protein
MTRDLFVAVTVAMCLFSPQLDAACPSPPPPCEKLAKADLVFVGEAVGLVRNREIGSNGLPRLLGIDQYRFNVTEAFKGVTLGDFWALFYYNPGSDTDSFDALNRRYLVFANRTVTGSFIAGCGWSRYLWRKEEESAVEEIRACVKKTP